MTTDEIIEALEAIRVWPEPNKNAGQGGPGPLYTVGILDQYQWDRENHQTQIDALLTRIRGAQ